MKKIFVMKLLIIILMTFVLLNCTDDLKFLEQNNKAIVSFSFNADNSRTVLPQVSLENVSSFKLFGGRTGDNEILLLEFTKEQTNVVVELMPGTWSFTLNAYNSNNQHILQGKVLNRQISPTGSNAVSFTLGVINSGAGNIHITLIFPQNVGITQISTSGDLGTDNFDSTSNGSIVYTKNNVTAGDYFISFELIQGSTAKTVVSELVVVRNNLTSSKTITLVGDDLRPVLSGSVSIVGNILVGETLTVNTSSLNGVGAVSYQWKKNGANIQNAINSSYVITTADIGSTITVTVTRLDYIGDVTSSQTVTVPALINAALNSVTGNGNATQTTTQLTFTFNQTITDLTAESIILETTNITGTITKGILSGVGSTYTLPISGFTSEGSLTVTVVKSGHNISGSHFVNINYYIPPLTGTINIIGTLQTGQIITADISNLNGVGDPIYQWKRGSTVVGTNSYAYTVVSSDVGNTNFTVTVTRANYTGSIISNPMLTGSVSISGTAYQGQTLTANTASLGGTGTISYQWKRGTTNIGTNSNTYILQAADVGSRITVTTTRSGCSGYITSYQTAVINPNPRLPYYYPGTGKTYNGFAGTEGNLTTTRGITINYPAETTFSADGFFILEGMVNNSSVSNYALIRVVKDSDTTLITNYFVRNDFNQRIWLRFGSGTYTITVCDLASISINSQGLISSWSYYNSLTFKVTNTRNEGDMRYIYPSYIIQSDDPMITSLASELTQGISDNTEKLRAIHDYIVKNTVYDHGSWSATVDLSSQRKKQDALSVLSTRYRLDTQYSNGHFLAVCEGYSNAFAAIARAAGFEIKYISSQSMAHAWNHMLLNGVWKFIDVTWNDPSPASANHNNIIDYGPSYTRYDYFNLSNQNGVNNSHTGWETDFGRSIVVTPTAAWQRDVPQGWY